YLIQQRDPRYAGTPVSDIVREMFSHADAMTMSAKKDGLANIGGFLGVNHEDVAARARQLCVGSEGDPTHGGLAGPDRRAIALRLREVLDEPYLRHRIDTTTFLVDALAARGIPVMRPAGGHAAYIDARTFLPHLPWHQYPAQALCGEIYLE